MTVRKISAAAMWLGSELAKEDQFATAVFGLGVELGLGERTIRDSFAEIGAHVVPGTYPPHTLWTLDAPSKQAFLDFSETAGIPSPCSEAGRAAYAAFWKARFAPPPPTELAKATAAPAAQRSRA